MRLKIVAAALFLAIAAVPAGVAVAPSVAQAQSTASRDATREKLKRLLANSGNLAGKGANFVQSTKQPYNFATTVQGGYKNIDSIEIVVSVTDNETIGFRVYPHYKGGYMNLAKAKDKSAFMEKLLRLSDENFLFWGIDDTKDVFCGYTFTLESGFPEEALKIVLQSIPNTDGFIGDLRPSFDGSAKVG